MAVKTRSWIFLAIFVCGAGIRALDLGHPVDGAIRESWREADYAAISRNFQREDMNILRPRIDWRGDGPGLAEMEFPAAPWLTALLYRAFGYNEIWGRIVSYIFSLLSILVFFSLARRLLPAAGAAFAAAFFVLAPLSVRLSNALQPESMMVFFMIAAVWAFDRWLEENSLRWHVLALSAAAAAILAKAPAAHIGIFFVLLLVWRKGWKILWTPRILAFGVLALLPAALWWLHAHRFWIVFGNSLGVSNEYHWIGWDLISHPRLILAALFRVARIEGTLTAMIPGLIIALSLLWTGRRQKTVRFLTFWLTAVALFYLVTIRTTGDFWASYYHVVSVPPLALLFGFGFSRLERRFPDPRWVRAAAATSFFAAIALIGVRQFFNLPFPRIVFMGPLFAVFSVGLAAACERLPRRRDGADKAAPRPFASTFKAVILLALFIALFPLEGFQTARDLHPTRYDSLYHCTLAFKPFLEPNALILASGGEGRDETGKRTAFNASYMFFWLDHKGFNIARDRQTLEEVASFARRGARYFILEKDAASAQPDFLPALRRTYRLLSECPAAYLFDLSSPI